MAGLGGGAGQGRVGRRGASGVQGTLRDQLIGQDLGLTEQDLCEVVGAGVSEWFDNIIILRSD